MFYFMSEANLNTGSMPVPGCVMQILNELNLNGYESYLVGGCVRDFIMGGTPQDYDIATNASVSEIETIFSNYKVIETGVKHGTVTIISDGMPIEVTTYRIDGTYSDGRHPDRVTFSSNLTDDLSRRDFTMNAVAYSPRDGFVDVFEGVEYIGREIIKCVGEPDKRFEEDALRILRALRFSAVLGFSVESNTSDSIHRNKALLGRISVERVTSEFFKLICGKNAVKVLREYSDVMAEIFPPLSDMFGFPQDNPYHIYDVWEHTLRVVENVPNTETLKIAALLHDVGKPHCRTTDENGIGHFYGHADISEQISCEILKKYLRTDKKTSEQIITLVKNHGDIFMPDPRCVRRKLIKYGEDTLRQLLALARGDIMAQSPEFIGRLHEIDEVEKILNDVLSKQTCFSLRDLQINGRELMEIGIEQGKIIGDILMRLLDEVLDEHIENEKSALTARAKEIYIKNYK